MKKTIIAAVLTLLAAHAAAQRVVILTPDVADIAAKLGADKLLRWKSVV